MRITLYLQAAQGPCSTFYFVLLSLMRHSAGHVRLKAIIFVLPQQAICDARATPLFDAMLLGWELQIAHISLRLNSLKLTFAVCRHPGWLLTVIESKYARSLLAANEVHTTKASCNQARAQNEKRGHMEAFRCNRWTTHMLKHIHTHKHFHCYAHAQGAERSMFGSICIVGVMDDHPCLSKRNLYTHIHTIFEVEACVFVLIATTPHSSGPSE